MSGKTKKKIRCIICPEGCMINASYNDSESTIGSIEGHQCKRGIKFAEEEIISPTRILTTTIAIESRIKNRLPVRSSAPAPKNRIKKMVIAAKKVKVFPPVKMGDVLAEDFLGTGVDLIASETISE